jgi:SRSO17 transposase
MEEASESNESHASILEHPEAQALLGRAVLSPQAVRGCEGRLTRFMGRYLPLFYRREQRENAALVIRGLLSGLGRKTCEPIAREAGLPRKPVQSFVGAGAWDDEAVMAEVRRHVSEELGDDQAVLVIDPSSFVKKGAHSCGVKRQWCGRVGAIQNCQLGVFLCYASAKGHAPLDRRLYLPEEWADDPDRRKKAKVPGPLKFLETWRVGLEMVDRCRAEGVPHGWVAGDDELGRPSDLRAALRGRGERYVLDVPSNTRVRDLEARRPPRRHKGRGRLRKVPFASVSRWAAGQPASAWVKLTLRPGSKGPLEVEALARRVQTIDSEGHVGPQERLLVVRRPKWPGEEKPGGEKAGELDIDYCLSNAPAEVGVGELALVHARRYEVERMLEEAKGEAGLGHYEVRSWVGWHHHMTLALVALWFLLLEKGRVGEKNLPRHHRPAGARGLHEPVA